MEIELPARYTNAVVLFPMAAGELVAVRPNGPGTIEVDRENGTAVFDPDERPDFKPMGMRIVLDDIVKVDGTVYRPDIELEEA